MVSHHPHQAGTHLGDHGFDRVFQALIGVWFAEISEVSGEHDRPHVVFTAVNALQKIDQPFFRVDHPVEALAGSE